MNRRGASALHASVILAFLLSAFPAAANTLPNGLELTRFEISAANPPLVGSTVTVLMVLTNRGDRLLSFDGNPGIFVAARWNSTGDENNRDFGHTKRPLLLRPGASTTVRATAKLDAAGTWRFWPGFRLNGHWGPFRWMEKTLEVYANPVEARSASEPITVARLLKNPRAYDQKRVTVIGLALVVRKNRDTHGQPWTLMSLSDIEENNRVMNVFGPGHPAASNGDRVRVSGIFRVKSPRGRYTFDNEIQVEEGGIVVMRTEEALRKADTSHRQVIDLRQVIGKPFDLGRVRGNLRPLGAEIPLRFQARAYTNLPNPNTIVRTGMGSAKMKVLRTERPERPGGMGSDLAEPGMTWLVVHLALSGNPANFGMPETFYQLRFGYDPAPTFFLTDAAGEVYWPYGPWENPINYHYKGNKTMGAIRMRDPGWASTATIFKVPRGIRQLTLVTITWQGGDRFEYAGVRLD
jgi:hypothetical protein